MRKGLPLWPLLLVLLLGAACRPAAPPTPTPEPLVPTPPPDAPSLSLPPVATAALPEEPPQDR
ncbi:MAG: hypothetical protein H5T59_08170, partial [Anaerolineae bacterium]|nr:hypothetical protein [Anaerolineae bacterium]